jgi:high-affinity Fe2+/Pb2+ permease
MSLVIQTLVILGLIFWFRRSGADKIDISQMILALVGYLLYLFVVFTGKSVCDQYQY